MQSRLHHTFINLRGTKIQESIDIDPYSCLGYDSYAEKYDFQQKKSKIFTEMSIMTLICLMRAARFRGLERVTLWLLFAKISKILKTGFLSLLPHSDCTVFLSCLKKILNFFFTWVYIMAMGVFGQIFTSITFFVLFQQLLEHKKPRFSHFPKICKFETP